VGPENLIRRSPPSHWMFCGSVGTSLQRKAMPVAVKLCTLWCALKRASHAAPTAFASLQL
jgi:hypothetical protein